MNAKAQKARAHTVGTATSSPMGANDDKLDLHERITRLEGSVVSLEKCVADQGDKIANLETSNALLSKDISNQGDKIASLETRVGNGFEQMATKQDITGLRGEMAVGFADVRKEMSTISLNIRKEMTDSVSDLRKEMSDERKEDRKEMSNLRMDMLQLRYWMFAGFVLLSANEIWGPEVAKFFKFLF